MTIDDHAATLSIGLVDDIIARRVLREVMQTMQDVPKTKRLVQGNILLNNLILAEMLQFKDRVQKRCEEILAEFRDSIDKAEP